MDDQPIDDLTPQELRVLGCLIEKEATVPDTYPLTLNSLRAACNQSTSRDPVVDYDEHQIEQALASLRARGLTRTVHSTSNRAAKYRHVMPDVLGVDPAETALLAVLMLRGPQTVGELKSRSARQHEFASVDDVVVALTGLADRPTPLVRQLDRQPGQKDARWIHLLAEAEQSPASADPAGRIDDRVRDVTADADPYGAATAEFYDLLATAHWERTGDELLDLLVDVDPAHGPIVDVGAGTGTAEPYLAAAFPGHPIHAIEPSKAMRTALHARLALDHSLRRSVTVDPRPVVASRLPERAAALVMSAVLGHLSDEERARLWRYVADRMPAGAPAIVELLPPYRPESFPLTRYRVVQVGAFTYEGLQSGEPAGERDMSWTMIYRVHHGEERIAEYTVRSRWRCTSPDDLRAEVAEHGLSLTEAGSFVVVRR